LVSLDFFHAYDRVDLKWVDQVLQAFGFGPTWRRWVQLLHRGASAVFMLHRLSPALLISFSLRQGDPLAMLLYIIQLQPLLFILQRVLAGFNIGMVRESALGYVDDVAALSTSLADLDTLDTTVSDFEAVSGALLNRNRKSVVVGLGSWAGRLDWPLQWIGAAVEVKIYGMVFVPTFPATVSLSWEQVAAKFESILHLWAARRLPTLALCRHALEVFAISLLWYLAQILPLPAAIHRRIRVAASAFLWQGRLERLAWDELHTPPSRRGLGLTCVATRAQALAGQASMPSHCRWRPAGGAHRLLAGSSPLSSPPCSGRRPSRQGHPGLLHCPWPLTP
jgi:Reverse transcriptase (RNA-dependent DNA polymerase)